VRSLIVLADVRLDLDDPGDATAGRIFPNETGAEQAATGGQRRPGEELPERRRGRSAQRGGSEM
jgi:hypothetical protein